MTERPIIKGKPSIQRACPMSTQKSDLLTRKYKETFRKIVAAVSGSSVVELTPAKEAATKVLTEIA